MRLILSRKQKTVGVLYKATLFQLTVRMVLDESEQSVLAKYKLDRELIYSKQDIVSTSRVERNAWGAVARNFPPVATNMQLTAASLLKGRTIKSKSFAEIRDMEASITQGCKIFKDLLAACPAFEGEKILEI